MNTKIKLAALAAVVGAGIIAPSAWAANLPFTFTPSDAAPSLTTNTGTLTADTLLGSDNAVLTITSLGNGLDVTGQEIGTIDWVGASLGGTPLNAFQLSGLNSGGPDNWNLTSPFTLNAAATSFSNILSPIGDSISLSYSLKGNATTLATGTLLGNAALSNTGVNPTLAAVGSFNIAPGEGPGAGTFFTSPDPFYVTLGASATSSTIAGGSVTTTCSTGGAALTTFLATAGATCTVNIVGGSAIAAFTTVPEPETVGLMGIGLVGLWLGRRKMRS